MFNRPLSLLKLEYAVVLLLTFVLYSHLHYRWTLFALLFLAPDLLMLGYLVSPRAGSAFYNLGHTLFLPLALLMAASYRHSPTGMAVAIIWISHIAFDRLLGYGLKYPTHFKDTHLQRIN